MRVFLYFCMDKNYMNCFKIELPKVPETMKIPYSKMDLERVLRKPNLKTCKFIEYRSWVITNYLFGTGNRLGTISEIKIDNINFNDGTIFLCKMKNGEQQIIPLCDKLLLILQEWVNIRKSLGGEYLFCTVTGEKLSKGTIQKSIADYNRSRGVSKTSVHLYRHTFALEWASQTR